MIKVPANDPVAPAARRPLRPGPWAQALMGAGTLLGLGFDLWFWGQFIARYPTLRGYLAQTDFVSWFAATRMIAAGQGGQLYDAAANGAVQASIIAPYTQANGAFLYHYAPALAGLLLPLAGLPAETALVIWIGLCALAFTVAVVLLVRDLGYRPAEGLLFALAAWSFMPYIGDLEMGQTSALLCLPVALGLVALRRGWNLQAGLVLGLLLLKPQHAIIWIVALVAARQWRALAGCAATGLVLWLISTWLAGPDWLRAWLNLSRQAVSETGGQGFAPSESHNFKHLISLIPGVGPSGANLVQLGIAAGVAAVIAWLWWKRPAGTLHTAAGARLMALTLLATLLATPILLTHDLTFWVLSAALLLAPWPQSRSFLPRRPWVLLAWIGWLVPWPTLFTLSSNPIKWDAVYMLGVSVLLVASVWRRAPVPVAVPDGAQPDPAGI
jgi:hypothetical protein